LSAAETPDIVVTKANALAWSRKDIRLCVDVNDHIMGYSGLLCEDWKSGCNRLVDHSTDILQATGHRRSYAVLTDWRFWVLANLSATFGKMGTSHQRETATGKLFALSTGSIREEDLRHNGPRIGKELGPFSSLDH